MPMTNKTEFEISFYSAFYLYYTNVKCSNFDIFKTILLFSIQPFNIFNLVTVDLVLKQQFGYTLFLTTTSKSATYHDSYLKHYPRLYNIT